MAQSFHFCLRVETAERITAEQMRGSKPLTYVLLTEAPPLKEGGHGCHVLTWNWLEAMGERVRLVVTHQFQSGISCERIRADLRVPVLFYPDLCRWRMPYRLAWLQSILEVWLFCIWLLRHASRIRAAGADRLFAFFGGSGWFLWVARAAARGTGLPLDVYLVDDLEESALLNGRPRWAVKFHRQEARVLQEAERVFVISPGYVEHLEAKYGVSASWLPVAITRSELAYHPYHPNKPDVRSITFLGAVNVLYLDSLRDFVKVIRDWNASNPPHQLRLSILTYADPAFVQRELGAGPELEVVFRCGKQEFEERLRSSWALFLPYSFSADVRVMVSTSFPTKLVDCFSAGRPVLVYGPAYASVPRYFVKNGLPLCVTRMEDLPQGLRDIERHDSSQLMNQYQATIERLHSSNRLLALLDSCKGSGDTPLGADR